MIENESLVRKISHREIYNIWIAESDGSKRNECVVEFISKILNVNGSNHKTITKTMKICTNVCAQLKQKWIAAYRNRSEFLKNNHSWLEKDLLIDFSDNIQNKATKSVKIQTVKAGRPIKTFHDSSDKTKKRRLAPIIEQYSSEELAFATTASLQSKGNRNAATMVKEIMSTPTRGTKVKRAYNEIHKNLPTKISPERALALFVDNKMTKKQYQSIRMISKEHGANIYPIYNDILEV